MRAFVHFSAANCYLYKYITEFEITAKPCHIKQRSGHGQTRKHLLHQYDARNNLHSQHPQGKRAVRVPMSLNLKL